MGEGITSVVPTCGDSGGYAVSVVVVVVFPNRELSFWNPTPPPLLVNSVVGVGDDDD
jgi:hypothetical protein